MPKVPAKGAVTALNSGRSPVLSEPTPAVIVRDILVNSHLWEQLQVDRPLRILIVDDEPLILELLSSLLAEEGCEIDTAGNGAEALQIVSDRLFDGILTDRIMPVMNGEDLAAAVKSTHPSLPIVMVTGQPPESFANLKVDAFILKPFTRDTLREALSKVGLYETETAEAPGRAAAVLG